MLLLYLFIWLTSIKETPKWQKLNQILNLRHAFILISLRLGFRREIFVCRTVLQIFFRNPNLNEISIYSNCLCCCSQPQVIKFTICLPMGGGSLSSVYSRFFHHKHWLPWYSWNIAESGVKHNKSNQINQVVTAAQCQWRGRQQSSHEIPRGDL